MQLRIHNYGLSPRFDFDFLYFRDDAWTSLKERVVSSEPIKIDRTDKEIYTCNLTLNNADGLLTPENKQSAYNLNADYAYDPLLD